MASIENTTLSLKVNVILGFANFEYEAIYLLPHFFLKKKSAFIIYGGQARVHVPCHSLLAPMGGRTVPRRERKMSALLSHWSSPPDFPGMTFSLGNHFLRASTAIFIFNLFSKSCVAHDNAATAAFALKTASTARRACTYERPRAAARLHVRPRRLSKLRQRTCTLFRPSGFLRVVGARLPPYSAW